MGIAGFFLWLQRWYPDCIDNIPQSVVESAMYGKALPSSEAAHCCYDNFYIDMNGLIHPCCHDTDPLPEPETEEEMFERIFEHIDLLVKIVRPRKCLVLCIDGVAPRSKMNQQRSRRFRAAEERLEGDAIAMDAAEEIMSVYKLPRPHMRARWDHNVITPSTAFMERVGVGVKWFILKKLNEDVAWRHLAVVFSDAHVPGEGEHKIMHYIRGLRAQPGYNPNTTHAIQGMDADLICLGLSSHERNVSILRNQLTETFSPDLTRYCFFNLSKYRLSLERDFSNIHDMNFERVLDDFIFLCFFVGNDFLPHIPLISIKTKGIELLVDHYVRDFSQHSYITQGGEVNFARLISFLGRFVEKKMEQLQREYQHVLSAKERAKRKVRERTAQLAQEAETLLATLNPDKSNAQEVSDKFFRIIVAARKEQCRLVADTQPLTFSFCSADYRDQYYAQKFGWEPEVDRAAFEEEVQKCCAEYFRGTQWVMRYYTKGCPSWEWFYPYHYAPLLQDLANFKKKVDVKMRLGAPLHPVEQLLAVLPRQSVQALPAKLHAAVKDPASILGHFYPHRIDVDYSEANFSYQGILRIPFIDCDALHSACQQLLELHKDNSPTLLFCHESKSLCRKLDKLIEEGTPVPPSPAPPHSAKCPYEDQLLRITPLIASKYSIAGNVGLYEHESPLHVELQCPDPGIAQKSTFGASLQDNAVRCYVYKLNTQEIYKQMLLGGSANGGKKPRKKSITQNAEVSPQRVIRGLHENLHRRKRARSEGQRAIDVGNGSAPVGSSLGSSPYPNHVSQVGDGSVPKRSRKKRRREGSAGHTKRGFSPPRNSPVAPAAQHDGAEQHPSRLHKKNPRKKS